MLLTLIDCSNIYCLKLNISLKDNNIFLAVIFFFIQCFLRLNCFIFMLWSLSPTRQRSRSCRTNFMLLISYETDIDGYKKKVTKSLSIVKSNLILCLLPNMIIMLKVFKKKTTHCLFHFVFGCGVEHDIILLFVLKLLSL